MIANFYSVVVSRNERESAPAYGPLPTLASSRPRPPSSTPHASGRAAHPLPVYTRREPSDAKERTSLLLDLREDLRVAEEEVLLRACEGRVSDQPNLPRKRPERMPTHLLADLDRAAAPARKEYAVSSLHADGEDVAILVGRTGADGDDGRLREGVVR